MFKVPLIVVFSACGLLVAGWVSQKTPLVSSISLGAVTTSHPPRQEKEQEKDQEKEKSKKRIVIPADDDQSPERRDFMRMKLQSSQFILEGLSVGDFDLVDKGIQQVKEMTKTGKWVSIDNEFYRELVRDFETATERLEEAAKSKNIDATALRYYQLTTNCIDCHKHIRAAAYEF